MLKTIPTNILVTKTVRGLVPALLRTKVAILRAISCFDSAAAIVNPPSKSIMTGVHIEAKAADDASLAPSLRCGNSSDLRIRSITVRKGTSIEVTKRGMT